MLQKNKKTPVSPHLLSLIPSGRKRVRRFVSPFMRKVGRHVTLRRVLLASGGIVLLLIVSMAVSFYWPRTLAFSYSQPNCFANPVLLPKTVAQKEGKIFKATLNTGVTIGGYPVYSQTTCVVPVQPPTEKTQETIVLGNVIKKTIEITPSTLPVIQDLSRLDTPVSPTGTVTFTLDRNDTIFEYRAVIGGQKTDCTKQGRSITCNMAKLNLAQSAHYTLAIQRLFHDAPTKAITQHALTTVGAIQVTAASITAGQTLYNAPGDLILTLNKPAATLNGLHLYLLSGDARQESPVTTELKDTQIIAHFTQPLARNASFILSVEHVTAPDGGYLPATFTLPFATSGGPKVLGVNIGSYRIQPNANITITFDSAVAAQSAGEFIRLEANGGAVATTIAVRGNTVSLAPNDALGRCTHLTVRVLDGLQNEFGISGGSAWQFKSRVICQTVFSIGTSVQGRGITAYSFGNGPSKIIFVGTTHGDEKSSTYTLTSFIDYLEVNADNIPAGRTIIVIPDVNPDGYAANRRTNANGVDLNRNFPANDWKSDVTMPDQSFNPGGGGSAPLSEPESSALASYVLSQNPRLVLTYHAVAGVVIPNDSGDSAALAHAYDQNSNLYFNNNSETDSVFAYDTTGSFEAWLHDKHDIAALLIELWTMSGNEFGKNQNAMWAMVQLP
jgi:hypothetical protein